MDNRWDPQGFCRAAIIAHGIDDSMHFSMSDEAFFDDEANETLRDNQENRRLTLS